MLSENIMGHYVIPIVYMKNDVRLILEQYKNDVLERLGEVESEMI